MLRFLEDFRPAIYHLVNPPKFAEKTSWVWGGSTQQSTMPNYAFDNTYDLSEDQLQELDEAEDLMLKGSLGKAEELLLSMLEKDTECIPVLSNLGHLYGRHLSEFKTAVEYYDRVLALEPDNAWARDARRRYLRYID